LWGAPEPLASPRAQFWYLANIIVVFQFGWAAARGPGAHIIRRRFFYRSAGRTKS